MASKITKKPAHFELAFCTIGAGQVPFGRSRCKQVKKEGLSTNSARPGLGLIYCAKCLSIVHSATHT